MKTSAKCTLDMEYCSSVVVEIEQNICRIEDGGGLSGEMARGSDGRHSIYRVPEYIKNMTNPNAYRPQVVSLGPFHHGVPALLPMEKHKARAVAHFVHRSGKRRQVFVEAVEEIKKQLQDAYENLDDIWRHDEARFVELMLNDGCFLIEMARVFQLNGRVEGYERDDPVFSEHGCLYLFAGIKSDVVLMENQLPLLLLQKLKRTACPDDFQDDGAGLNNWVLRFLCSFVTSHTPVNDDHLGLHPLDVLQKSMCGTRRHRQIRPITFCFMPCAAELHEAGIRFKLSAAKGFGGGITFKGGVLNIPNIFLYDNAECLFLNLMAFERLHPDSGNDVTAFVFFLDLLIDTAKDVALLRSKEIIKNGLGSDKAVADLIIKTLTKGAVLSKDSTLWDLLSDVNAYYKKPLNKLRASFIHTYFSNPWVFFSLVPATILLIATVMQTVYTIVPFYNKK